MPSPTTLLLLALSLTASAADKSRHAPGLTAEGDFCELIWNGESWERVSCFTIEPGPDKVTLEGVAWSWQRAREDGTEHAPQLATWELDSVVSYAAASQTLVYEQSGTMTNTESEFTGQTSVSFDLSEKGTSTGWYGNVDRPTRFRMLTLVDLEACLGVEAPASERLERWKRVANTSKEQLATCVPPPPKAWVEEAP